MGIQKNNISMRDLSHSELRPLLVDLSSQNQLDLTKTDVLKGLAKGKLQRKGIGVCWQKCILSVEIQASELDCPSLSMRITSLTVDAAMRF
jgi:hypothetical protein